MFFVYLLASKPYGSLYVGVTSNLLRRVWEHKNKVVPGFTNKYGVDRLNKYGVDRLVWYEAYEDREAAIRREEQIKERKRIWKIELIEHENPHWLDLYPGLVG